MRRKKFESIILHVGHDKTGSTSIQSALDLHRGGLLREGVLYPHGRWHHRLGSYFHDEPENYGENPPAGRARIRSLDEEWMGHLLEEVCSTSARHVIMSYEDFFSLPEIVWIRIRRFLLGHTDHIRLVGYCRRPEEYAVSAISQRVKSGELPWGSHTGGLAELRASQLPRAPDWRLGLPIVFYRHELPKMARVFGKENVLLRKFGRDELPGGDVVADFLSLFGLSDPLIRKISGSSSRENPSLGAVAIRVGVFLIQRRGVLKISAAEFRARIVPLLEDLAGPKPVLNDDERWIIREASRKDSVYLEKEWGISFRDKGGGLSAPLILGEEEVESLAADIMKRAGI
jgi:hypothetical protein